MDNEKATGHAVIGLGTDGVEKPYRLIGGEAMSTAKRWMEEIQSRGYGETAKQICADCIGEEYLELYIRKNCTNSPCSYCNNSRSAPLEDIIRIILEGFYREYQDPDDCVGWCSKEGGWLGVDGKLFDTADLLLQYLNCDENAVLDISKLIIQEAWVERDPYYMPPNKEMLTIWELFSEVVKHKTRYVFFRSNEEDTSTLGFPVNPVIILDEMARLVSRLGLIETLPAGSVVTRGRCSSKNNYYLASDLGSPPNEFASSSRMSPAGISMFYGASDDNTCCKEIVTWSNRVIVSLANWKTLKDLKILNLNKAPAIPSLFDKRNADARPMVLFLHDFINEFSKKVTKSNKEVIDYVPTQIVTEYFRRIFRYNKNGIIDGIKYKSSVADGDCLVLFCPPDGCWDGRGEPQEFTILQFDPSSVHHITFNK